MGGTKTRTQEFPLGKQGEQREKDRRPPVDEGSITPWVAMGTSTGQLFRKEPPVIRKHTHRLTSLGAQGGGWGLP